MIGRPLVGPLPDSAAAALAFAIVPLRYRRDGWTPARQLAFLGALAECGCVLEACRRVGMSAESAYRLYRHRDGAGFRRAWAAASAHGRRGRLRQAPLRPAAGDATHAAEPAAATSPAPRPKVAIPSTSATPDGSCRIRRDHQLPRDPTLPRPPPYSFAGFVRASRRSRPR
jgi:hypothetical protein